MFYAWDKDGNKHSFHHAVDWKTVIRDKGFSPTPPGAIIESELAIPEGEAIDGIELANEIKMEEMELDPKIIIGERKPKAIKAKTKIER